MKTDSIHVLEGQLRECYGRVVYSHKTHEKCADILLSRHKCIKIWQIALSAVITGGIASTLFEDWKVIITAVTAVLSTILLALNAYTKDYDLGAIANKHRHSAEGIWLVREKYLSLLSDLRSGVLSLEDARKNRDALLEDLHNTYKGAPITDNKAYQKAQKALKELEDMTFSDEEIDAFLPKELKRTSKDEGNA